MNGYVLGLIVGAFISVFIILLMITITRNDKKLKCNYDERQQLVRGKGFKYAFLVELIGNSIIIFINPLISDKINCTILIFLVIGLGALTYGVYCIFNDAYFSLNDNPKRFMILFGAIGFYNLFIGILTMSHDDIVLTDPYPSGLVNIICAAVCIGILIAICIKKIKDLKEANA